MPTELNLHPGRGESRIPGRIPCRIPHKERIHELQTIKISLPSVQRNTINRFVETCIQSGLNHASDSRQEISSIKSYSANHTFAQCHTSAHGHRTAFLLCATLDQRNNVDFKLQAVDLRHRSTPQLSTIR